MGDLVPLGMTFLDPEGISGIDFEENFSGQGEDLILHVNPGESIRLIVDDASGLARRIEQHIGTAHHIDKA